MTTKIICPKCGSTNCTSNDGQGLSHDSQWMRENNMQHDTEVVEYFVCNNCGEDFSESMVVITTEQFYAFKLLTMEAVRLLEIHQDDDIAPIVEMMKEKYPYEEKEFYWIIKKFKEQDEKIYTFTVCSTYGKIICESETGRVLTYNCKGYMKNIRKFDVEEYAGFKGRKPYGDIDILNIGYWYMDNGKDAYEEPAHEWRQETALAREDKL